MISISSRLRIFALAAAAAASLFLAAPKSAEAAPVSTGIAASVNDARPATVDKAYYYVRRYYRPRYRYYRPYYRPYRVYRPYRYYRPYRRFYY